MNLDNGHWDPALRAYLLALPEAEPPPELRQRVLAALPVAARPAPLQKRPWLLGLAAAVAMAALTLRMVLAPAPVTTPVVASATAIGAAQALEHRVLDRGLAAGPAQRAGIAGIDRALAEAYRREAGDEELDALWRARSRALDAIDKGLTTAPVVPARI